MTDPKDQGMTAQEAAGRFCSWYIGHMMVSDDPWEREQALWRAPPELSEMLRHEIQDQSDDYAPVPLWATGRRVPVDPNRPPELLSTDMWRYLDLDIEGNQAAGGGLEYVDLRIYDAEPRADDATARDDQLQRAAEPPDKRPRNRNVDTEALFKNHIEAVIAKAKTKWPYPQSRPGINQMARLLVDGQPKRKVKGFGQEAIRKILAGTYKPAKDRGIPGLSSG